MDGEEATRLLVDAVGPLYDRAGLQEWLDLTEDSVLGLARDGKLLTVRTLEGDLLFPSFQFGPDGEFLPSLDRVLKALGDTLDDWSIALWIVYRDPQDGISNFERLRSGDAETVVQRATRRAEILRH
ncbi:MULTISPECIES: hypothetical protein [unclassified Cryobacterium]|uniref:hypothetical protein n=1 Tax=unclassified Cryobacterium TaxID=2649013 RepID=UPI002AB4C3A6|nr:MULTISPECIES: hypothetical protein [unclassified Cryobacterium]MDY7529947.1 hypothetical protein [Cryobacterium sp. 10C2]MDY7557918.1 hypothetical protein [Cryobacterium sp. 10C3]MEB0202683.1 hypothetical protein [Cryobacterium sp. 5I3]MEB0287820.1 hypothetical protein [Cryobacterium sp. 10S3]MEB0290951.1 hypothetical protein [Cryobacterium sp. 10C2]